MPTKKTPTKSKIKKPTKAEQKVINEALALEEKVEAERDSKELFTLRLTRLQLIHLRDALSVRLPPTYEQTLSEILAERTQRTVTEVTLWEKLGGACEQANIALGDEAPDYVIGISGPAPMSVFEVQGDTSMGEDVNDQSSTSSLFEGKKEEDD
jgi:hypothetical protein